MAAQSQELSIREKTDQVIATLELPTMLAQIEEQLPEGVTLKRFVGVSKTALRTNPGLATVKDQTSLFGALLKCAQDGLLPDGRQAALVAYKDKVSYIPMIDGIRAIAATYGWQIRTNVVYENDEFDYTDEPPEILHRPVRPGMDRGNIIAAYAVAHHRDGRRMQTVLHPADVAKRRAMAQTDQVWSKWPEAMWEKSAGHDIFGQLSLDPADARVDRILREGILADPLQALYGVNKTDDLRTDPASPEGASPQDGAGDAKLEEAASTDGAASAASSPEPAEDGVWEAVDDTPEVDEAAVEKAAQSTVRGTVYDGQTFAEIATDADGPTWFLRQLKKTPADSPGRAALDLFVSVRLPDVWAKYQDAKEAA